MANITLFAQAIGKLPKESIRKIIREEKTDKHCKGYDTWSQSISMIFCQFSGCDSVRKCTLAGSPSSSGAMKGRLSSALRRTADPCDNGNAQPEPEH